MDYLGEIIIGCLGLIGTLCGSYFSNKKSSALFAYRMEQLEKKVEKHNNVIERTFLLEKRVELDEEKLRVANHRIADLEKFHV